MTTHTLTHSISHNRLTLIQFPKLRSRIFGILGFCLILSLLMFYVFQINETIQGGYLIKNYLKKIDRLSQESKLLEIDFAHISSLGNIEVTTKELNFEKITQIKYLQILESPLATK